MAGRGGERYPPESCTTSPHPHPIRPRLSRLVTRDDDEVVPGVGRLKLHPRVRSRPSIVVGRDRRAVVSEHPQIGVHIVRLQIYRYTLPRSCGHAPHVVVRTVVPNRVGRAEATVESPSGYQCALRHHEAPIRLAAANVPREIDGPVAGFVLRPHVGTCVQQRFE